jgi:murein DD-endopeptidase MepM/ murein hydrolase activator NlpD
MSKKTLGTLAIILTVALFAGSAYWLYSPRSVYEVSINGQSVGYVGSLKEYKEILSEIHSSAEEQWGCELVMSDEVHATQVKMWSPNPSPDLVKATIQEVATYKTSGWAIMINGETAAFVESEALAWELIDEVTKHFVKESSNRTLVSVSIQEEITVSRQPIEPELLLDRGTVLALLLSGQEEISTYVVQRGETLSGIARSYNTSVSHLRTANPNLKNDTIQIGQVLNLQTSSALLHVKTVEELKVTETIARSVQYQANPDMTVRNDKVLQAGSDGSKQVTYKLSSINGTEIEQIKLSTSVIRQSQTKVVLTGIGQWPALPTGMFRFPLNTGRVSSPFGVLRRGGAHRGVDIATSRGTPIYAAADGTVRTRAFSSSYGYYVVIDHANGYSTLYAHASSIDKSVKVGQKVVRGQVIAYVGSTGVSTGPHLHWEVTKNGQLLNPLNFFKN